jgi:hypothetical protein
MSPLDTGAVVFSLAHFWALNRPQPAGSRPFFFGKKAIFRGTESSPNKSDGCFRLFKTEFNRIKTVFYEKMKKNEIFLTFLLDMNFL